MTRYYAKENRVSNIEENERFASNLETEFVVFRSFKRT